jgi:hypothetical protein
MTSALILCVRIRVTFSPLVDCKLFALFLPSRRLYFEPLAISFCSCCASS